MSPLASCRSYWSRPGPELRGSRPPPTLASWPRLAAAEPGGRSHNNGAILDQETWKPAVEQDSITSGHGAPGYLPMGLLPAGVISQLSASQSPIVSRQPGIAILGACQVESCHTWSPTDLQYVWTVWTLPWNVSTVWSLAMSGCPTVEEHPVTASVVILVPLLGISSTQELNIASEASPPKTRPMGLPCPTQVTT